MNVYRDGELLVAPIKGAEFPNWCVVSNREVNGKFDYMETITRDSAARLAQRAAGHGSAVLATAAAIAALKRVTLQIGLSEDIASKFMRTKRRIVSAICIGAFLAFIAVVGEFVMEERSLTPAKMVLLACCLLGLLLVIGGTIALVVYVRQPLKLAQTDGTHVWLSGAGESFLASLPKWETRKTGEAPDDARESLI